MSEMTVMVPNSDWTEGYDVFKVTLDDEYEEIAMVGSICGSCSGLHDFSDKYYCEPVDAINMELALDVLHGRYTVDAVGIDTEDVELIFGDRLRVYYRDNITEHMVEYIVVNNGDCKMILVNTVRGSIFTSPISAPLTINKIRNTMKVLHKNYAFQLMEKHENA